MPTDEDFVVMLVGGPLDGEWRTISTLYSRLREPVGDGFMAIYRKGEQDVEDETIWTYQYQNTRER